jgi:hypothetical protein
MAGVSRGVRAPTHDETRRLSIGTGTSREPAGALLSRISISRRLSRSWLGLAGLFNLVGIVRVPSRFGEAPEAASQQASGALIGPTLKHAARCQRCQRTTTNPRLTDYNFQNRLVRL